MERRGGFYLPVGGDDQSHVHETADEDFEILEHLDDFREADRAFDCAAALVFLYPGLDVSAFIVLKPLGIFRKARDDEKERQRDRASQHALEDENPAPSMIATHSIHFPNRRCKQSSEGARKARAPKEE